MLSPCLAFLSDYSDMVLTVLSEILHWNEAMVFCEKRGHFNGNIAGHKCAVRSHISLHVSKRSIWTTKQQQKKKKTTLLSDPVKEFCFHLPHFTVHENTIANRFLNLFIWVSNETVDWNKCKWGFFFLYYDFSPSVHRLTVSQYESMKMATAFLKPVGISASHLDSN